MRACRGADGCKGGWVAAIRDPEGRLDARVFAGFDALLDALPGDAAVAVDMPIGLPERAGHGGRGPEAAIREFLRRRRPSVFSVPSRSAVYARSIDAFLSPDERKASYREVCHVAALTSEPSRKISQQCFAILPKIQEVDRVLRAHHALRSRVIESHPEAAFWQLNNQREMANPKKSAAGVNERRALLAHRGLPRAFLDRPVPRRASQDDFLDACAMLLVAERFSRGEAVPFPDPPLRDGHGIPIAIWT